MKVTLVTGLFGESVFADCYIDGNYYDFIKKTNSTHLINMFGEEEHWSQEEYVEIEKQLREQASSR